jgi:hypothetical protein
LRPKVAVLIAGALNLVGAFLSVDAFGGLIGATWVAAGSGAVQFGACSWWPPSRSR